MTGLSPGAVLPKDMDQRQWARWNREQAIDNVVGNAIDDHEAKADPHPNYVLESALADLNIESGSYTPAIANVTNLSDSTAYECQYLRVGSVVHVTGKVSVTATASATPSILGIALPIASNLQAEENCSGIAAAAEAASQCGAILADTVNNRALLEYTAPTSTASEPMFFSFSYQIL